MKPKDNDTNPRPLWGGGEAPILEKVLESLPPSPPRRFWPLFRADFIFVVKWTSMASATTGVRHAYRIGQQ